MRTEVVGLVFLDGARPLILGEEGEIDAQDLRCRDEATGGEAILAVLVFLHGLEAKAEMTGELLLGQSRQPPRDPQSLAGVNVMLVAPLLAPDGFGGKSLVGMLHFEPP